MIEHFSKWIELKSLLDCINEKINNEIFNMVFSGCGFLIEILTNQGMEFHAELQIFCKRTLINHHTTSQNHPKENGLAWFIHIWVPKRSVQF